MEFSLRAAHAQKKSDSFSCLNLVSRKSSERKRKHGGRLWATNGLGPGGLKWDVRWARTESLQSSSLSEGAKGLYCHLRKCLDWEGKRADQWTRLLGNVGSEWEVSRSPLRAVLVVLEPEPTVGFCMPRSDLSPTVTCHLP